MLADDILEDQILPHISIGLSEILAKIKVAQKFILAPDFALAADSLMGNLPELQRIGPFCRLPYDLCWFEFAHMDRIYWRGAPIHFPDEQSMPSRIGYLMEALNKDLNLWKTTLCWSLKDFRLARHSISELAVIFNTGVLKGDDLNDSLTMSHSGIIRASTFVHSETHLQELARSDWAGEVQYIYSILGLLNTRNVPEIEDVKHTKLNRKREKRGKPLLLDHKLLKIRAAQKHSFSIGNSSHRSALRGHFVRGHFKTRKYGIFWWGPHMRGNVEQGIVSKDYQLER